MSDYEELDSFTEDIVKRTRERQKLLNDNIDGSDSFVIKSKVSKTSLKSFDNESNKMCANESPSKVSDPSKQIINNLISMSSDKKRVPLSQRLGSIARSYGEDTENLDFIDSEITSNVSKTLFKSERALNLDNKSNIISQNDNTYKQNNFSNQLSDNSSPDKKRVPLSQRLNSIARSYHSEDTGNRDNIDRGVTSNSSKTSLKIERVVSLDNKSNIIPEKESTPKVNDSSKPLTNNSIKKSPDKKIITSTQRLGPIPRSYDYEETKKEVKSLNTLKTVKKWENSVTDSPPKKKLHLQVSNNILMKRQLLQQSMFGTETSTANSVMKDVEKRKKELELLKRPFKRNESSVESSAESSADNSTENANIPVIEEREHILSTESEDLNIDNETAHQTVCEAFEDIENYSLEQSEDEIFNENKDVNTSLKLDLDFNESPTKKNRLYPELIPLEEGDEIHGSSPYTTSPPPLKPPRLSEQSGGPSTPMRTISFYRREQSQKSNNTTSALQTIVFSEKVTVKEDNLQYEDRNRKIQERIDQLRGEVDQHNRIAGQASQALNLCLETNEFKGSTEHVEAEKLLLLSAQKRIACLNEISKLKISLSDKTYNGNTTKGCLSLHNIQLPIKGEFLVSRAKGIVTDIHHFICLIYNGANVVVTDLLNSDKDIKNGKLDFSCGVYLPELSNDFNITVQVFDLITQNHQMPHDVKYHIKKTPKKGKLGSMKSPTVRSPGGPNAVLSTSFSLVGVVNINLSNYMKKSYKLENFCYTCPLDGSLFAKTELKVEHNYKKEGFFDIRDKSGFWTLRWFVLRGHQLAFWRFPEEVNKKPSLGTIDLKECINPKVSIIPTSMKHICMRPNTIPLITIKTTPKDSNVFSKGGTIHKSDPIKYLISLENKDNCIEWCQLLTTVLNNIRLWDCDSIKPYSTEEFEKLLTSLD